MYMNWLIISCDLLSLLLALHILGMWMSNIMAITKGNGDIASHWNMALWIFTSDEPFLSAVNSTLQVWMVFSINC